MCFIQLEEVFDLHFPDFCCDEGWESGRSVKRVEKKGKGQQKKGAEKSGSVERRMGGKMKDKDEGE
jgi:hypothetical protein